MYSLCSVFWTLFLQCLVVLYLTILSFAFFEVNLGSNHVLIITSIMPVTARSQLWQLKDLSSVPLKVLSNDSLTVLSHDSSVSKPNSESKISLPCMLEAAENFSSTKIMSLSTIHSNDVKESSSPLDFQSTSISKFSHLEISNDSISFDPGINHHNFSIDGDF